MKTPFETHQSHQGGRYEAQPFCVCWIRRWRLIEAVARQEYGEVAVVPPPRAQGAAARLVLLDA
jgi:hypothetical protein